MAENDPSEFNIVTQWVIFIILLFFIGFSIANAVFYAHSRENKDPNPPISKEASTTMMVINIILAVLATIFAIVVMISIVRKTKMTRQIPQRSEEMTTRTVSYSTPYSPMPMKSPLVSSNPVVPTTFLRSPTMSTTTSRTFVSPTTTF
jgi:NADH:ubiquinone oxidoreductase subunit 5 (subunit L)/multisubunit Na+/H+ antiporter MnhA subunit